MVQLVLSGGSLNKLPKFSIGGEPSSTVVTSDMFNNLFDDVSRVEVINEVNDFRCIYVHNNEVAEIINTVFTQLSVSENTKIYIGVEDGTAQIISNETQSPVGIVFYDSTEFQILQMPLGNIGAGLYRAIWIRRQVFPGNAVGDFSTKVDWDILGYGSSGESSDRVSVSESYKFSELEFPSKLGRFLIGEGVMS